MVEKMVLYSFVRRITWRNYQFVGVKMGVGKFNQIRMFTTVMVA
jgi:hypothetical protein